MWWCLYQYDIIRSVRIISKPALRTFWEAHPAARSVMEAWYRVVQACDAKNFSELKRTFNTVDLAGDLVIFDVGGNKYRIAAGINFRRGILFIKGVFTHKDYDEWNRKRPGRR